MQKLKNLKRTVEVSKHEQMVRITFTIGISGRFIDMTLDEALEVRNQLNNILESQHDCEL